MFYEIDMERGAKSMSWFEQVKEFSTMAHGDTIPTKPTMMTIEQVKFIRKMANSEFDELEEAINEFWNSDESGDVSKDLAKQSDALVDAIYYLMDCGVKSGVNLDPLFQIVQNANMAKFANGVIKSSEGKVLKPRDWKDPEPELIQEIERQLED